MLDRKTRFCYTFFIETSLDYIKMNLMLESLIKHMQKNADIINSTESYSNGFVTDSQNLATVMVGETLGRLAFADASVLAQIISVNGKARYDKREETDGSIDTRIAIWFMFKFEQEGRQIKVSNLSLNTTVLVGSMTAARQLIRENYR